MTDLQFLLARYEYTAGEYDKVVLCLLVCMFLLLVIWVVETNKKPKKDVVIDKKINRIITYVLAGIFFGLTYIPVMVYQLIKKYWWR